MANSSFRRGGRLQTAHRAVLGPRWPLIQECAGGVVDTRTGTPRGACRLGADVGVPGGETVHARAVL